MRKGERRAGVGNGVGTGVGTGVGNGVGTGVVEASLGKEWNESVKGKDRVHVSEWNAIRKC